MIIVRLKGGLGNQMFQYAAARRLAHHNGVDLKLDLSFYDDCQSESKSRHFELCHLLVNATIASRYEVANLTGADKNKQNSMMMRLLQTFGYSKSNQKVYLENHFHFDPVILDLHDNVFLDGYWQSERYFKDIEAILRKELSVKYPLALKNLILGEEIMSVYSVSLHVRRGDYVNEPKTNSCHGTCNLSYYKKCVAAIAQKVAAPHFYIFSDDPCWVRDNLSLSFPATIIHHNGSEKAYEDIRLMSLCKHNIIANSSFSWWGAWLNQNPDKMVFAPQKWFNYPQVDTSDLLPEKWVKIGE